MKKLLSIILVLLLVASPAFANSAVTMAVYNSLANSYGAPELTKDMITTEKGNEINFYCNDMIISFDNGHAVVIAADSADFLPACVCASLTIAKSTDGAISFFGNLLYSYMTVKSGKTPPTCFFNTMCFTVNTMSDGKLFFFIGDS